jgi:hypothetical protein
MHSGQYVLFEDCHMYTRLFCPITDNVSVHRAHIVGKIKQDNDIHSMIWPAQSLDLDIIENLWLCIKRSLQYPAYNINTPWNFLLPFRIYG